MNENNDTSKLWREYWQTHSPDLRNQLIGNYMPLCIKEGERVFSRLHRNYDRDIMLAAGIFSLMDTIQDYSPDRTELFEQFAKKRIRRGMITELRRVPYEWWELPKMDRLIVVLRRCENVAFNHISDLLDIQIENVTAKYNAALSRLPSIFIL